MKLHGPGEGQPKNFTQMISLVVGTLLFVLGLCGMLFSGFAGLHIGAPYAATISIAGGILFYNGYKNNSYDAFVVCLIFTLFFGFHALAGWLLGRQGVPDVGNAIPDKHWLVIIPGMHELGTIDHILNTVIALVLAGGAIDWKRRDSAKYPKPRMSYSPDPELDRRQRDIHLQNKKSPS